MNCQLVKEQVEQATNMIQQFSAQGSELKATAGLLANPDMKMSAMVGPQQNKARAILADLVSRSADLEKAAPPLQVPLIIPECLAMKRPACLHQLLTAMPARAPNRKRSGCIKPWNKPRQNTEEAKKWMADYSSSLSSQVVELVSGMSRSSSRTRMLPGEMANTSTDVGKAVDEQLQALDALASISGAAINTQQLPALRPTGGQPPSGQPPARTGNMARSPTEPLRTWQAQCWAKTKPVVVWRSAGPGRRNRCRNGEHPLPTYRPATSSVSAEGAARRRSSISLDPLDVLRMDDIARALDSHTAALAWNRSQSGERNVFSQRLYTPEGQQTFEQITQRYHSDDGFRNTVEKYVNDFEGMLNEADQKDPSGRIVQNYITSETGRAYLMLAHIAGRLG